jgi:hypothetical protein
MRAIWWCWRPAMLICRRLRERPAWRRRRPRWRRRRRSMTRQSAQQQAGVLRQSTRLRAQVEYQTRQQQLIRSRQDDFAKQKISLARVIGLAPRQEFELADKAPYEPFPIPDLETSCAARLFSALGLQGGAGSSGGRATGAQRGHGGIFSHARCAGEFWRDRLVSRRRAAHVRAHWDVEYSRFSRAARSTAMC